MYPDQPKLSFAERNRVIIKATVVAVLVLIMLIPTGFVTYLVAEREQRQKDVTREVSSKWAEEQIITGPVLLLPYKHTETTTDGKKETHKKMIYVLPDELNITGDMQPTEKKRSIYSVMLHRSALKLTGKFGNIPLAALHIDSSTVLWDEAKLAMNITDLRGIEDQLLLDWNGNKQLMEAGIPANQLFEQGISTPVAVNAAGQYSFSLNVDLRGSGFLYFSPVGKTTQVDLAANWGDPSFDGQYLPGTSAITEKNFKAHWKILPLSHAYPQCWADGKQDLERSSFGVRLIQPVDGYAKTFRSVKYAILFIALTFTCFFFFEITRKRQIHPLQYILVGLALSIFYTLLLSVSEYTGFNNAYIIAAAATISLIGMYAWSMFKDGRTAAGFTLSLTGLYTYIFVIIQLEDYALLVGSIGLFAIITIIMYFSRKIDWYGITCNETHS